MKKRLALIIAVICALAIGLCACGGGSNGGGGGAASKGEEFSCEKFSAVCPDGWQNLPYEDMFAEVEGTLKPDVLEFIKGKPENEFDVYGKASVIITCADPDVWELDLRDMYENVQDVSFEAGGLTWTGYTGELLGYKNLNLSCKTDACLWQISCTMSGGDTSFEIDDADFISILESLQMK